MEGGTIDAEQEQRRADVLVYGATSGGVVAAVAAARSGSDVMLVDPTSHVGGMVSGGLTRSDVERQEEVIGGLARDFFVEVSTRSASDHPWRFEPRTADEVLRDWIDEHGVTHLPGQRVATAETTGTRITSITTEAGWRLEASVFIDASYEGDLLAAAGVTFDIGRDGRSRYGESLSGRAELLPNPHQFAVSVPAIGADGARLPHVRPYDAIGPTGHGDGRLQSYCYRVCLTDDPDNRIELEPPDGYDPADYALVRSYLEALGDDVTPQHFMGIGEVPNAKLDINSHGPVSTNLLGGSWGYPTATPSERALIETDHRRWAQGLLYLLGHDEAAPEHLRRRMRRLGLPGDEFVEHGNWPPQLYVRDARRLVGEHVLTQQDLQDGPRDLPDAVGMGGYNIDIREVQWVAAPVYRFPDIFPEVLTEGYVSVPVEPYPVPYRALLPRREECENLLVSTCVSTSHVAFASFRMEPQFMIAGHAAGLAAVEAGEVDGRVHEVDVDSLRQRLVEEGQIIGPSGS